MDARPLISPNLLLVRREETTGARGKAVSFLQVCRGHITNHRRPWPHTVVSIPRNTRELSSSLAALENVTLERTSARTLGKPWCSPLIPNSSQKMPQGDPSVRGRALHPS